MKTDEISTTLKKCELFRALDDNELQRLSGCCTVETHRAGETVYGQGQSGDRLWILYRGQVSLLRKYHLTGGRTADVRVFLLKETDNRRLFGGWYALVGKEHDFLCTATCDRDSRLVVIDGATIRKLMVDHPDIRIKILEVLVMLLRGRLESSYESFESI
jgi:CRP-like cAMP-binding protein